MPDDSLVSNLATASVVEVELVPGLKGKKTY